MNMKPNTDTAAAVIEYVPLADLYLSDLNPRQGPIPRGSRCWLKASSPADWFRTLRAFATTRAAWALSRGGDAFAPSPSPWKQTRRWRWCPFVLPRPR